MNSQQNPRIYEYDSLGVLMYVFALHTCRRTTVCAIHLNAKQDGIPLSVANRDTRRDN